MAEGVSDIVQRLLDRAYAGRGVDTLCEQAAAELERLRQEPCPHVTGRTTRYCTLNLATAEEFHAELARLRLTDAEREAVDVARTVLCCTHDERRAKHAATLRGLLARLA